MAHYDCNNCGASMGIGYGICKSCTPKEVFEQQHKKRVDYQTKKAATLKKFNKEYTYG